MAAADITNGGLGKLFSVEFLTVLVALAVSWGALTQKVDALDDKVEENKAVRTEQVEEVRVQQKALTSEVNNINRKLDVMVNNQDHFKAQITEQDKRLTQILEILQH